jgi:hypothetical protein
MIPIYQRFEDAYIYGPITEKELEKLSVYHRHLNLEGQHFIGTSVEIPALKAKQIIRPEPEPVSAEPVPDPVPEEPAPADGGA